MKPEQKSWVWGYAIGFCVGCLFSVLIWLSSNPSGESGAGRGGSASVGGCGVTIGGASGDDKPGQVVIRKCPQ